MILVLFGKVRDLVLGQQGVELEMAFFRWHRLGSAAKIVCAIVDDVEKVCWRRCVEMNRQKATEYGSALEYQSCGKSVLHLESAWGEEYGER